MLKLTIALCELYGMTDDKKLKEAAQRALDYCYKTQSPQGGWYARGGIRYIRYRLVRHGIAKRKDVGS